MKKGVKLTLSIAGGIIVAGGIATSLILNIHLMKKINKQQETINRLETVAATLGANDSSKYTEQENDVPINDGEYRIRDTSALSDAYKSGDYSALSDDEKETLDMADAVLKEIITDDMSDYEKEKAVYEWMCTNISDDSDTLVAVPDANSLNTVDRPYGVLKNRTAVCVGYATTFRLFMNMLDIECMVVHDDYLSHSWNLVHIGDGWYFVDVYMDAGYGSVSYSNFNQTEEMFRSSHDWNMTNLPAADSTEYCYITMNTNKVADVNEAVSTVYDSLFDGGKTLAFVTDSGFTASDADTFIYMLDQMSSYLDNTDDEFASYYYINSSYTESDDGCTLIASIEYWGDDEDDSYSSENESFIDTDAADKALAEIMGISEDELYDYGSYTVYENDSYEAETEETKETYEE